MQSATSIEKAQRRLGNIKLLLNLKCLEINLPTQVMKSLKMKTN